MSLALASGFLVEPTPLRTFIFLTVSFNKVLFLILTVHVEMQAFTVHVEMQAVFVALWVFSGFSGFFPSLGHILLDEF